MTLTILNDLLAQSLVDPDLEARLVANITNLDAFIEIANAAGYPLTKESLLRLTELPDEALSTMTGGNQQDHKKWIDVLLPALKQYPADQH